MHYEPLRLKTNHQRYEQNFKYDQPRLGINTSSNGAISKHVYNQIPQGNQAQHEIQTNLFPLNTNQDPARTNLVSSLPQPVLSNIPINSNTYNIHTTFIPSGQPSYTGNQQRFSIPNMNQPPPPPYMDPNPRPHMVPSFNESLGSIHHKIVPIHKWKIRYNGDGSVNNFLFQVHTLRRKNLYDEEDMFNNFDLLLEGRAENFYWRFTQMNPGARYAVFVRAFSVEFGSTEKD